MPYDKINTRETIRESLPAINLVERKLCMSNISINARSSIRIEGTKVIYFDPFKITEEKHDADIIFVTHEHYDHFSPEDMR